MNTLHADASLFDVNTHLINHPTQFSFVLAPLIIYTSLGLNRDTDLSDSKGIRDSVIYLVASSAR